MGEIDEISAELRLLSHQTEPYVDAGIVVSHDRLMHLTLDRFVKQPPSKAGFRNGPIGPDNTVDLDEEHELHARRRRRPPRDPLAFQIALIRPGGDADASVRMRHDCALARSVRIES